MTHPKFSRSKAIGSLLLLGAVTVALSVAPVAFGQEGKGGSANDWFMKSAKDRKEKTQTGISGGEKRDIIPSMPGMPIPQTDQPFSLQAPLDLWMSASFTLCRRPPTGGAEAFLRPKVPHYQSLTIVSIFWRIRCCELEEIDGLFATIPQPPPLSLRSPQEHPVKIKLLAMIERTPIGRM